MRIENNDFNAEAWSRFLNLARLQFRGGAGRIDKYGNGFSSGHGLMQQAEALRLHIVGINCRTSDVGTWPVEAYDKSLLDGIAAHDHHGGNSRGCSLGGKGRWLATAGDDQCHAPPDQIGRHRWQLIVVSVRPAIFDLDVLTLDVAGIGQCFAERREQFGLPPSGERLESHPITGIGCCARAANGQAAATPPRRVITSRRRIATPELRNEPS